VSNLSSDIEHSEIFSDLPLETNLLHGDGWIMEIASAGHRQPNAQLREHNAPIKGVEAPDVLILGRMLTP